MYGITKMKGMKRKTGKSILSIYGITKMKGMKRCIRKKKLSVSFKP